MPSGDKKRVLDVSSARTAGLIDKLTPLEIGLEHTVKWYLKNKQKLKNRHSFFLKPAN